MTVTVVIVTQNSEKEIGLCVESLKGFMGELDFEIVVVDNGSSDNTVKVVKGLGGRVRLLVNRQNEGVARARHKGVMASRGEYVFFLDDDAYIKSGSIKLMIDRFRGRNRVGVVSPKVVNSDGDLQYTCRKFPNLRAIILWWWMGKAEQQMRFKAVREYLMLDSNHNKQGEVDWTTGVCQVFKRSIYDELGGLDVNYFYGYEDVDMCYRMAKAGYKIVYLPEVVVVHDGKRRSNQGMFNIYTYHHIRGILRLFIKKYKN